MVDKEPLKEMPPQDLIDAMSTPENSVGRLKFSLEEQANTIHEALGVESEFDQEISLLESLEEIRSFDKDVYVLIIETIIGSIKSKKLKPEDIPKLILNFSFSSEADREMLEHYGSAQGAMTWSGFRIILHDSLKGRDNKGNLNSNVGHHLNHEIGHSITEIGAISQEEIEKIFAGIGTQFESAHVQRLLSNDALEELILKERFAECVGIYLRSASFKDFIEKRGQNCANKVERDFESVESQKEFVDESKQLYDRIGKTWPSIQTRLAETDLSEHLNQLLAVDEDDLTSFDESQVETYEEVEQPEIAPSSTGGSEATQQSPASGAKYNETPELAKNQKHSESFNQVVQNLFKGFAEEVDIFQGVT